MAAVPAPDGRPPRPAWQAAGISLAYAIAWTVIGFGLAALIVTAVTR